MTQPYLYPTDSMRRDYVAASLGMKATGTQLDVPMAPPVGGWQGFKRWAAATIFGADAANVWFAPQQPLPAIAQSPDAGAIGRAWDYPVGWNTRVTPRSGDPVTFKMLRNLASYDVLRILIERVKDEICNGDWSIQPADKKGKRDARCDEVQNFLAYPDKDHPFRDWLKMLLDQVLVYDAPAIWLQPTRGGDLYALQIIDGSTIQPKIMADGRLPPPEIGPAFQEVLKGMPSVDYVRPVRRGQPVPLDSNGHPYPELLYKPRVPRVDSPYGYGPVEQCLVTIQIGLAREEYLKSYYTDGSAPDTIFGVPTDWNAKQIADFQTNFNAILAGNLQARRQVQFVPGGFTPYDIKEKALTDETDQWLIRVMAFCLGMSPLPFIKVMNRATAGTHQEQQKEEGQTPRLKWVRDLMNYIIEWKFGYRDVVFRWEEEASTDPLEQAQIDEILARAKIRHPDEIRIERGDEAMSPELRDQMDDPRYTGSGGPSLFGEEDPDTDPDDGGEDDDEVDAKKPAPGVAAKLGKALRRADTGRRRVIVRPY